MPTLMDKRTGKPFRSCIEAQPIPGESLMLGVVMCLLIVAVVLFIWAGSR